MNDETWGPEHPETIDCAHCGKETPEFNAVVCEGRVCVVCDDCAKQEAAAQ